MARYGTPLQFYSICKKQMNTGSGCAQVPCIFNDNMENSVENEQIMKRIYPYGFVRFEAVFYSTMAHRIRKW